MIEAMTHDSEMKTLANTAGLPKYQTSANYLDDIIDGITSILSTEDSTGDANVLQRMLESAKDAQISYVQHQDEDLLLSNLETLIATQFILHVETRRALANKVRPIDPIINIEPNEAGDVALKVFGSLMARNMSLKIAEDLGIVSLEGDLKDSINRDINFFTQQIADYEQNSSQRALQQTQLPQQPNTRVGLVRQLLHIDPSSKKFYNDWKDREGPRQAIEAKSHGFLNVSEALVLPSHQTVDVRDLLITFQRDFRTPNDLKEEIKLLKKQHKKLKQVDELSEKIENFIIAAISCDDALAAVDFVFKHASDLIGLNIDLISFDAELEAKINEEGKASKSQKKKKRKMKKRPSIKDSTAETAIPTHTPTDDEDQAYDTTTPTIPTAGSIRSQEKPIKDLAVVQNNRLRWIHVQKWAFSTYLDDNALDRRLDQCVDRGTFRTLRESVAYHINKHAPEMTAEDYLDEALQPAKKKCRLYGEIVRRLTISPDGYDWIIKVRSEHGIGGYSQVGNEYKVIWYQPHPR